MPALGVGMLTLQAFFFPVGYYADNFGVLPAGGGSVTQPLGPGGLICRRVFVREERRRSR